MRQKAIRSGQLDLGEHPCNAEIECDSCGVKQKNRFACYFCNSVQRCVAGW